jgi:hypothetical protein
VRIAVFAFCVVTAIKTSAAANGSHNGEPIRLVNGFPVIVTVINGKGPFRLLIDTGATRCAVRRSVALRASLIPHREVLLATMVGENRVSVASTAVRVGARQVPEAEVVINDLPGLDRLESHVDGLLGQNVLAVGPYLIDYKARRLWFDDPATAKAQRFGPPKHVEFSFNRPILSVRVDSNAIPSNLILDSGVDHLVTQCGNRCGMLIDERTVQAVTNAGEMLVQKGRVRVAVVGPQKFFRMEAVFMKKTPDPNNADGSVPLAWFAAVYVDPVKRLIRLAQ